MKITIELNDTIIDAIAQTQANAVALSWWDACGLDYTTNADTNTTRENIKTLYKHAFGDGIRFLIESQK